MDTPCTADSATSWSTVAFRSLSVQPEALGAAEVIAVLTVTPPCRTASCTKSRVLTAFCSRDSGTETQRGVESSPAVELLYCAKETTNPTLLMRQKGQGLSRRRE